MENNNATMPASEAQITYLKKLGYTGNTQDLTNAGASHIIKQLREKQNGGSNVAQNFVNNYQAQQQPQQEFGWEQPQQQPQPRNNYQPQQAQYQAPAVATKLGIAADELSNSLTEMANDGMLFIPENYSVGNAIKSAVSKILTSDQCDKLLACTPESKKQALTEYVVQGLDASKNQAYFIPYGNKMTMMRSYFGDVAVAKRTGLVKDVFANVIYEGDTIEVGFDDYGRKTLLKHETVFNSQDNEIIGAYAVVVGVNGYKAYEFMTRKELEASWKMSKMPNGKLHSDYKQEAAKRTVIRRAVKMIFNSSLNTTEEQTALIGSYNRTTSDEYDNDKDYINAETKESTTQEVKESQKSKTASKKIAPEVKEDAWLNND